MSSKRQRFLPREKIHFPCLPLYVLYDRLGQMLGNEAGIHGMLLTEFKDGIHVGHPTLGDHLFYHAWYLVRVDHVSNFTLSRSIVKGYKYKERKNHKEIYMALDTNNNFTVAGFSGEAVVATDYNASESSHFQVIKLAYGDTAEYIRVTDSVGLPVEVINTPTVTVSSVSGTVSVTGILTVQGTGGTPVGVTAIDLDIRSLTAGDPTVGLAPGADFVRVVGYSGGYPIGVSAANFGIRALTAGDPTTGLAPGADFVRIVGYSGGYPIGVTAVDLDIRSLTFGSDSVSVFNTVSVQNGEGTAHNPTGVTGGLQTRILRATKSATPTTSSSSLNSALAGGDSTVEDTVRVVGLSGAYPVDVLPVGVTSITDRTTRVPFHVDDTGALYVNLAAGTIGVTATISGSQITLAGISLAVATTSAGVLQVHGYTGPGAILVGVTATDLDIRNLTVATDAVYAQTRVLSGSCGDEVGITGAAWKQFEKLSFVNNSGSNDLRVFEPSTQAIGNNVSGILAQAATINDNINSVKTFDTTEGSLLKVDIRKISQPDGGTANRIGISTGATNLGTNALKSGVHFKSDLNNTATIFVGFNSAVSSGIGYPLYNGDQIFIETNNTSMMWVSATAGATLYYIGT